MATTTADNIQIIGGVDTHQDLHTAAVVSHDGTVLGTESFSTTRAGYRAMLRWFRSHGELFRVGVESTGTYGAGITRHLALSGSVGDSYDNALAETINGLYKAEVIHRRGPWRSFGAVELATLE